MRCTQSREGPGVDWLNGAEPWYARWVVRYEPDGSETDVQIHRLDDAEWDWSPDGRDGTGGVGSFRCGLAAQSFGIPGVVSRLYAPRCPGCCAASGVPEGKGNPYNQGVDA